MKTNNLAKFILVAFGLLGLVFVGVTQIETNGLAVIGEFVGFVAALAILALAAMDNTRPKRLV